MRRRLAVLSIFIFAAAGVLLFLPGSSSAREGGDKTPWKIVGQLEEGCSCDKACPCWFDSKPTKMNCSGNQVLFIEKGSYGDVKVDGLALANFVQSPNGRGMMESFGQWNFSYLYLDEKANPEQRKALEAIGMSVFPMAAAPTDKRIVRNATIKRVVSRQTHEIDFGQ